MTRSKTGRSELGLNGPGKPGAARSWTSLFAGLACALVGTIGFTYLLLGPFYRESGVLATGQQLPPQSHGLIGEGVDRMVLVQLLGLVAEIIGVAVGAFIGFRGIRIGTLMLWCCTLLLSTQAAITLLGMGWLFAPSALLAIVASVAVPQPAKPFNARGGNRA